MVPLTDNIDKFCELIKSLGYTAESQVRDYLATYTSETEIVDGIVNKLRENGIITESSLVEDYKRVLTVYFRSHVPVPREGMKAELAKMQSTSDEDAETLLKFCENTKLLEERNGRLCPAFDMSKVKVERNWKPKPKKEKAVLHSEPCCAVAEIVKQRALDEMKENPGLVGYPIDDDNFDIPPDPDAERQFPSRIPKMEYARQDADAGGQYIEDCRKTRETWRTGIIKNLVSSGVLHKTAIGLFDYFELNSKMTDLAEFTRIANEFEKYYDDKAIEKAYSILTKESWT